MDSKKRRKLEQKGWSVGTVGDFLKLTTEGEFKIEQHYQLIRRMESGKSFCDTEDYTLESILSVRESAMWLCVSESFLMKVLEIFMFKKSPEGESSGLFFAYGGGILAGLGSKSRVGIF